LALSIVWAQRRRFEGEVFLKTLIAISALRFLVDFTRELPHGHKLAVSQIVALAYVAIGLGLLYRHCKTSV
jgi:prolipoprotein diacylglyceryltransferase